MVRRKKFRNQMAARTRISQNAVWERMWAIGDSRSKERRRAEPTLVLARKHSFGNRVEISQSSQCACFCCLKTFSSEAIRNWCDQPREVAHGDDVLGITAECPFCGIDSVLGDQCGFELSEEFLKKMKQFWFDDGLVEICYSTRGGSWQLSKRRPKSPTSESQ